MLLQILLGFLCAHTFVAKETGVNQTGPPPLLLVSFDGFRADYLKRFPMPNLKNLYSQGVLVEEMTNVFVTKTFPNHYSLVTPLNVLLLLKDLLTSLPLVLNCHNLSYIFKSSFIYVFSR